MKLSRYPIHIPRSQSRNQAHHRADCLAIALRKDGSVAFVEVDCVNNKLVLVSDASRLVIAMTFPPQVIV